jgi:hypothetical protein
VELSSPRVSDLGDPVVGVIVNLGENHLQSDELRSVDRSGEEGLGLEPDQILLDRPAYSALGRQPVGASSIVRLR